MKHHVRDIVTLRATTPEGEAYLAEHGTEWLVREIDASRISRNLGMLLCPASYVGTDHLNPLLDQKHVVFQQDGESLWTRGDDNPGVEVAS